MAKPSGIRPANLFFIELLVVLLFFGFSTAVVLRVFTASDKAQYKSDLTEKAVICAQSLAESFSVTGDLSDTVECVFNARNDYGKEATVVLGDDFGINPDGKITLVLVQRDEETKAGVLSSLEIGFVSKEGEIFSVTASAYNSNAGGADNE